MGIIIIAARVIGAGLWITASAAAMIVVLVVGLGYLICKTIYQASRELFS